MAAGSLAASAQVNVLTVNYGNERSNANLQETLLTPARVAPGSFGKLGTLPVDGQVYAQPLYVSGLSIPGKGPHNVVYLVTEHNSVFAYDADAVSPPSLLWHVNLGPSVPNSFWEDFYDVAPEIGILSTGVIDLQAGVIYLVAETLQDSQPRFDLHALDLGTGGERLGGPVAIAAQVAGTAPDANNGIIAFDASSHLQRPGLLLWNGGVYFTFGSHGDLGTWHGWVFRYNASDLRRPPAVFITTSSGTGGSIWQSGRGLTVDDAGSIYAITGNGDYDGLGNFSESFLKLTGVQPVLGDWFTPSNPQEMSDNDADLSAGVGIVPGTHLLVGGDKWGNLYLVDGDHMGHGTRGVGQVLRATANGGIFNFAIWNHGGQSYVFIPELEASFKCFAISGGAFIPTPVSVASGSMDLEYAGMSLSANGSQEGTGILWATTGNHSGYGLPGTLHAFDASNLANELWNSDMTHGIDDLGTFAKFANPTVVNGKVYVPTWSNTVAVYGLLPAAREAQNPPAIAAVSNAASFAQSAISPGEIVTIFGQNLGGNPSILFDGIAAPMVSAAPGQVSAVVPPGIAAEITRIQVQYGGQMSNVLSVPVVAAAPGIFSAAGSGMGQALAFNQDGSPNSTASPAPAGSVVVFYATGAGRMNAPALDDSLIDASAPARPVLDVSARVGGQPASVVYSGTSPGEAQGLLQVKVKLPQGVAGPNMAVVLTVGNADSQPGITLAVRSAVPLASTQRQKPTIRRSRH